MIQDHQEGYITAHNESWGGESQERKAKGKGHPIYQITILKKTKQLKSKKLKQLGVSDIATEFTTPVLT